VFARALSQAGAARCGAERARRELARGAGRRTARRVWGARRRGRRAPPAALERTNARRTSAARVVLGVVQRVVCACARARSARSCGVGGVEARGEPLAARRCRRHSAEAAARAPRTLVVASSASLEHLPAEVPLDSGFLMSRVVQNPAGPEAGGQSSRRRGAPRGAPLRGERVLTAQRWSRASGRGGWCASLRARSNEPR
jgi:hypothetical protein